MTLFFLCLAFLLGILVGLDRGEGRFHAGLQVLCWLAAIVGLIGLGYGIANLLR
jgi:hypothetical protein